MPVMPPTWQAPEIPRYPTLVADLMQTYMAGLERARERARQEQQDAIAAADRDRQFGLQQRELAAQEAERQRKAENERRDWEVKLGQLQQEAAANTPLAQAPGADFSTQPPAVDESGLPQLTDAERGYILPQTQVPDRRPIDVLGGLLKLPVQYKEQKQAEALNTLRDTLRLKSDAEMIEVPKLPEFGSLGGTQTLPSVLNAYQAAEARKAAAREGAANRAAIADQTASNRELTRLQGITTKFQADKIMQQAFTGSTMKAIADQVIANPQSAQNQLASLYILVKNLDPESAVREGELKLADATQSYFQKWGNTWARLSGGRVIDPQAAVGLAQATKEIAAMWDANARMREAQYRAQAATLGVGPQFETYLGSYQKSYTQPPPQTQTITTSVPNVTVRRRIR